jgi:hypothetical protein
MKNRAFVAFSALRGQRHNLRHPPNQREKKIPSLSGIFFNFTKNSCIRGISSITISRKISH